MSHFLAFQTWLVNLLGENGAVIAFYGTVLLVVVSVLVWLGVLIGWLKWGREKQLRNSLREQLAAANAEIKVWQDYWNCESPHDTHVQAGTTGPWRQLGNEQARANRLGYENDRLREQLAAANAEKGTIPRDQQEDAANSGA